MNTLVLLILISLKVYSQSPQKHIDKPSVIIPIEASKEEQVLQAAIDYSRWQWVFIDSTQLVIQKTKAVEGIKGVHKFGKPAVILDVSQITANKINHYLIVEKLEVERSSAFLVLRYPSQGVRGEFKCEKQKEGWVIKDTHIYEN